MNNPSTLDIFYYVNYILHQKIAEEVIHKTFLVQEILRDRGVEIEETPKLTAPELRNIIALNGNVGDEVMLLLDKEENKKLLEDIYEILDKYQP